MMGNNYQRPDFKKEKNPEEMENKKNEPPPIHTADIMDKKDYKKLVGDAKEMGLYLYKKGVKSTQFRRIFTHIKRIQMKLQGELKKINNENKDENKKEENFEITGDLLKEILLIKPKMAYTAGRHTNLKSLYNTIIGFIDNISTVDQFNIFYDFIEATLAYHKLSEGGKV